MNVNTAKLRQFINEHFGPQDLNDLLFDYFRSVHDDVTPGMTKRQQISLLLEFCHQHSQMQNLLAAVAKMRPFFQPNDYVQGQKAPTAAPPTPAPITRNPRQIFISHAHQDAAVAQRLAHDLEAHGYDIWIAPDSIRPGEKWVEAINRGLDTSGLFVLLMSPEAVASEWVNTETNIAIELQSKNIMRFIPLKVGQSHFPALWSSYHHISFMDEYESGLQTLLDELKPGNSAVPQPTSIGLSSIRPRKSSPTKAEGYERILINEMLIVEDSELLDQVSKITPLADAHSRLKFARSLAQRLPEFYYHGPTYTAWRMGNRVFLSTLPGVINQSQKTYELEILTQPKRVLSLNAIWETESEEWQPFSYNEFHEAVAGLMADRSGCFIQREASLVVLRTRGVVFRFPVTHTIGVVEEFCQWVKREPNDINSDWDRNPRLTYPGIGVWNTLYHNQTQEGILIVTVIGSWSNQALHAFRETLKFLIPRRHIITPLSHGAMRVSVHLVNFGVHSAEECHNYTQETISRVRAAFARMVAAQDDIQVDPPSSESKIPRLTGNIKDQFKKAVQSLEGLVYPKEVQDYPSDDGTDTWGELRHYIHAYSQVYDPYPQTFRELQCKNDLFNFIDEYENRHIPVEIALLMTHELSNEEKQEPQLGEVNLTLDLQVVGGIRSLKLALDEVFHEPKLKESPMLRFKVQDYSRLAQLLHKLSREKRLSERERRLRQKIRKVLRKFMIWGIPPDTFLQELFLLVYRNLYAAPSELYNLDEFSNCLAGCIRKYSRGPDASWATFSVYNRKVNADCRINLTKNEADALIKELGVENVSWLVGSFGLEISDFSREIQVERIYPAIVFEYLRLKYVSSDNLPDEKVYFVIEDWSIGLA